MLTHTSGIDNRPLVWATAFTGLHDPEMRHRLVQASYPDQSVERGAFNYTNVGYNVLSVYLDRAVESQWQDQLRSNIFAPVGMTRTSAYASTAEDRRWRLARPYSILRENRVEPLYLYKTDSTMHAAGGMIASAPDLARFLLVQLNGDRLDGEQVLPMP